MPASPENEKAVVNAIRRYVNASLSNYRQAIATGAPANVARAAENEARRAANLAGQVGITGVSPQVAQAVQSLENQITAVTEWRKLANIIPNNASRQAYINAARRLLTSGNVNNIASNKQKLNKIILAIPNGPNRQNIIKNLRTKARSRINQNLSQITLQNINIYKNNNKVQKRYSLFPNKSTNPFNILTQQALNKAIQAKKNKLQSPQ